VKLIKFRQLKPEKGITYTLGWLLTKAKRGEFPAPLYLSPRALAWVESEVDAWLVARLAERDARLAETAE
jgi:prophage regulatory protein